MAVSAVRSQERNVGSGQRLDIDIKRGEVGGWWLLFMYTVYTYMYTCILYIDIKKKIYIYI